VETNRKKAVSPGTINRELNSLKAVFTKAEKVGKFDGKNPVKSVKYLPEQEYIMRILKPEEIDRLVSVSKGYT
jgi:site-specific recombinase XerD